MALMHLGDADKCPACWNAFQRLRCNCGAGELGHTPDCSWVLGADDLSAEHDDAVPELELVAA